MIIKKLISLSLRIALILAIGIYPLPAFGFVLLPTVDNNTTDDIANHLLNAVRWTNVSKSLVNQNIRGLGGGIEYAIAPNFCSQLSPRFIDLPQPSCEEIQQSIKETFDLWAKGHTILKFVNVSSSIKTQFTLLGNTDLRQYFGAEIDLFAMKPDAYFPLSTTIAYTSSITLNKKPIGTNSRSLDGGTIMSADIVFNLNECYYLNTGSARQNCNHFPTVLLHEIGHALGLDHPDEYPLHNFDSDNDPKNEIVINCQNPIDGLKPSQNIDRQTVMNSRLEEAAPIHWELSLDDIGGRNFLYPICLTGKDKHFLKWQFLLIWVVTILLILVTVYKYEKSNNKKRTKV